MSHCKDGEDIASIVLTDELDLTRLHEESSSLIESISIEVVIICIRNN